MSKSFKGDKQMINLIQNQIEVAIANMVEVTSEFQRAATAYECLLWVRDADRDDEREDYYFKTAVNKADWSIKLAKDLGLDPNVVCKMCVTFMDDYKNKIDDMGLIWRG